MGYRSGFVLVWPVFGALVTHGLGRRLIPLSVAGQSANANFRSELVYAREKVQSPAANALSRSENEEFHGMNGQNKCN